MSLFEESKLVEQLGSTPRQVFDVTGAGDTVLAAVAMASISGASPRQAMRLAIAAADIAIGQMGAATVTLAQLESALETGIAVPAAE
jgi:D-beta-D-heptose 7-phosphate kinase/D-beta-D-heptose 1-phosphate adenosyltransferase